MIQPLPPEAIGWSVWLVWILIFLIVAAGLLLKFWRYRLMAGLLQQMPENIETMRELLQEIKMLRKEIEELRKELKE